MPGRDLTEKDLVETAGDLSRERGLIGAILNHSPHGIIVSDVNGKLVLQNKAAESIWAGSASADNVAGWGKYRAFHSDGRPYEPTDWSMARALANHETTQPQEIQGGEVTLRTFANHLVDRALDSFEPSRAWSSFFAT